MKKRIIAVMMSFLVIVLLTSHSSAELNLPCISYGKAPEKAPIDKERERRENLGLPSTIRDIEKAKETGKRSYGLYLTAEEKIRIDKQIDRQGKMSALERTIRKEAGDNLAGLYIDQSQKGMIYVGFKDLNAIDKSLHEQAADRIDDPTMIAFIEVDYSQDELSAISDKLSEARERLAQRGIHLISLAANFKHQTVTVVLKKVSGSAKRAIIEIAGHEEILEFKEAEPYTLHNAC